MLYRQLPIDARELQDWLKKTENRAVTDVFKMSRLDKVWRMHEDIETALQHAT